MTTNERRIVNLAKYESDFMGKQFVGFMLDPNALEQSGRAAFEVSLLRNSTGGHFCTRGPLAVCASGVGR